MKQKQHIHRLGDESGMVVAEAAISFTAFIMVCLGITFLINIFTLHNKVQFAINQAAHEIASYSYLYDAFGARNLVKEVQSDFDKYAEPVDTAVNQVCDTVSKMQGFGSQMNTTVGSVTDLSELDINNVTAQLEALKVSGTDVVNSGKQSLADLKTMFSDPKGMLVGIVYIGVNAAGETLLHAIASAAGSALSYKYMESGGLDVDAYLENFGIEGGYDGLDFSGSSVFCDDDQRIIDLVCEYDIDLSFITYVLPKSKFHVVQRVSVAAWAGGDDQVVTVGIP